MSEISDWNKLPRDVIIKTLQLQNDTVTYANKYIDDLKSKLAALEKELETCKSAYSDLLQNSVKEIRARDAALKKAEEALLDIAEVFIEWDELKREKRVAEEALAAIRDANK